MNRVLIALLAGAMMVMTSGCGGETATPAPAGGETAAPAAADAPAADAPAEGK